MLDNLLRFASLITRINLGKLGVNNYPKATSSIREVITKVLPAGFSCGQLGALRRSLGDHVAQQLHALGWIRQIRPG